MRPIRTNKRAAVVVALCAAACLLVGSCSKPEPIDGFWGYTWGTPIEVVLADTAQIRYRLGGDGYEPQAQEPMRLVFRNVQYGMGYGEVALDFTSDMGLWHGHVRVPLADAAAADSIVDGLHERFGGETALRRFQRPEGTMTHWYTRDWFDRDFFAPRLPEVAIPDSIDAVDLFYGGCLIECPLYSIRLARSGRAYLWSIRGRKEVGGFVGRFDAGRFPAWAAQASAPEFVVQSGYYGYTGVNLTKRGTRIRDHEGERIYESVEQSGPPLLETFVDSLESGARHIAWSRVFSWDTLGITAPRVLDLDSLVRLTETLPDSLFGTLTAQR